jgi:hypothetical protein
MAGSSLAPQLVRESCAQKQVLIDDIRAAISEILQLHNEEFEAVLNGNFDSGPDFQERLRIAREHKVVLLDLYREHVNSHGC